MKVTIDLPKIIKAENQNNAYQKIKDTFEPEFLSQLLEHSDNNKQLAARIAGFHVSTLNGKLKRHGLTIEKQIKGGAV